MDIIEELGVCTVRLIHRDKNAKCRFFVVPGDDPALLGMTDIELLNILKVMCEVIGVPPESRKFNLQTIEASDSLSSRTNKVPQNKTDKVDAHDDNANMPDYSVPAPAEQQIKGQARY